MRVGLTGNIGSGKSSVARLLERRGAVVIDADALARQATEDPVVLGRIASELGRDLIVTVDGRDVGIDRAATARLVFEDRAALTKLNAIVHPWVAARRAEIEAAALTVDPPATVSATSVAAAPRPVIVNDIPLLYENGLEGEFDVVVVVYAPRDARAARVLERSGLSFEEFDKRDAAQLPLAEKAARADIVVDNSGDPADLETEVARLWDELTARSRAT